MKLRYTLRGAAELAEVLAYIEERSPQGARHVQARIQAIVNLLLQYPHAGQPTSEGRLRRVVASPLSLSDFLCCDRGRGRYSRGPSQRPPSINHAMTVANPVQARAFFIDKKAPLTNSKTSDQKIPAEETSLRFSRKTGAEGATAPETLRPTDRSGMTLWKAIFHVKWKIHRRR